MPLFSIIVPTYNHGDLIQRCIDSVISQTIADWEMIIVNNFSDDDTIVRVKSYNDSRIKLINYRNNGIIAASRNRGIKEASGKWICFLDSDDWWYPEKLEIVKQNMHGMDILYHDLDIFTNNKVKKQRYRSRQLKTPVFVDLMINENALLTSSTCVRQEILSVVGGFSEDSDLVVIEDYDLWLRIAQITEKFKYIPDPLGGYWKGDANTSGFSEKSFSRTMKVFDKYQLFLGGNDRIEAKRRIAYTLGRIKQYEGNFSESKKLFYDSVRCGNKTIKLKSIICLLEIIFCRFLKFSKS